MHRMLPAREKRADCALLFARLLQAAVALEGGPLKRHFFWKNAMLKLLIGNKNYSSWSMRPWVLLRQMGIAFEEVLVRFDSFQAGSQFKSTLLAISPVGKVPVLQDGDLTVWDTLAIAEYLAERHPELALWPRDRAARARARSVCADMHAGFSALRSHCPMNIEANLAQVGALIWRDQADVRADVARLVSLWQTLLNTYQGPMLFGDFCMADAYFAPVCTRLKTYALPVPPDVAAYVARVLALPGVQAWVNDALAEHDFLAFEEPYRTSRGASR
jgi:glutathione S-transferase